VLPLLNRKLHREPQDLTTSNHPYASYNSFPKLPFVLITSTEFLVAYSSTCLSPVLPISHRPANQSLLTRPRLHITHPEGTAPYASPQQCLHTYRRIATASRARILIPASHIIPQLPFIGAIIQASTHFSSTTPLPHKQSDNYPTITTMSVVPHSTNTVLMFPRVATTR